MLQLTFQTTKLIIFVKKEILTSTLGQFRSVAHMANRLPQIRLGSESISITNKGFIGNNIYLIIMKNIYVAVKADKNTKCIVLINFIIMWKSAFVKDKYIFISDSISIIKLNFMIASLVYIHFSHQEQLTSNLAVTYSLEYHHELGVVKAVNGPAHCYKSEATS